MRKFTKEEIFDMANKSDHEYIQQRIAKVKALKEKERRRLDAELRARRAAVEIWVIHKLVAYNPHPTLFAKAMENEARGVKEKDAYANKEVTAEEMHARSEGSRGRSRT